MGLFRARGYRRGGEPFIVDHVEAKLAAHMVEKSIKRTTLVINNLPCPGREGCLRLVPVLLPAGYSMTIHGPNGYKRTLPGGKPSPWR